MEWCTKQGFPIPIIDMTYNLATFQTDAITSLLSIFSCETDEYKELADLNSENSAPTFDNTWEHIEEHDEVSHTELIAFNSEHCEFKDDLVF
jgi:hypothetical protein